jgi:uncharacterized delta-60 repeat protein
VTRLGGGYPTEVALAIQPDGKILAGGLAAKGFALARYNPDGSLDPSFGQRGTATTAYPVQAFAVSVIALEDDGKIVAAGSATRYRRRGFDTVSGMYLARARYLPDGRLDPSFGRGGKLLAGPAEGNLDASFGKRGTVPTARLGVGPAIAFQADGKLIASGTQDGGPPGARRPRTSS